MTSEPKRDLKEQAVRLRERAARHPCRARGLQAEVRTRDGGTARALGPGLAVLLDKLGLMPRLSFRQMRADDLRLLHEWLQREHVRTWWSKHKTYEDVVEHYLPAIEGRDPTDLFLILRDDRPIGFIQTYLVSDYREYAALVQVGERVAGVDLFIADAELTGKGVGSEVLRTFTQEVVFSGETTIACVADPDGRNIASIRAFEKAGFSVVREFFDPTDAEMHALMRLDRGGEAKA